MANLSLEMHAVILWKERAALRILKVSKVGRLKNGFLQHKKVRHFALVQCKLRSIISWFAMLNCLFYLDFCTISGRFLRHVRSTSASDPGFALWDAALVRKGVGHDDASRHQPVSLHRKTCSGPLSLPRMQCQTDAQFEAPTVKKRGRPIDSNKKTMVCLTCWWTAFAKYQCHAVRRWIRLT